MSAKARVQVPAVFMVRIGWTTQGGQTFVTPSTFIILPPGVAMISRVRRSYTVRVGCTTNVTGPFLAKKNRIRLVCQGSCLAGTCPSGQKARLGLRIIGLGSISRIGSQICLVVAPDSACKSVFTCTDSYRFGET